MEKNIDTISGPGLETWEKIAGCCIQHPYLSFQENSFMAGTVG